MRNKRRAEHPAPEAEATLPSAAFTLPPVEEAVVPYLTAAPSVPAGKEIHPRRAAPAVPDAPVEPDRSSVDQEAAQPDGE